ncbi:hypothetical protein J6590_002955 [Homalodisca vitripennis]|nr:hypothetical protein J6590_002955 [Homalodisca vitripennis]
MEVAPASYPTSILLLHCWCVVTNDLAAAHPPVSGNRTRTGVRNSLEQLPLVLATAPPIFRWYEEVGLQYLLRALEPIVMATVRMGTLFGTSIGRGVYLLLFIFKYNRNYSIISRDAIHPCLQHSKREN